LNLSKDHYITIVRKKTASLLAACCHAGGILGNHNQTVQTTLKGFGLNFGIAFQIIDDCKDLISEERALGKHPGQDVVAGDMTLPLLDLLDAVGKRERQEIKRMFESKIDKHRLEKIRRMYVNSNALSMTRHTALYYINQAKCKLNELENSDYKKSLDYLIDYIIPSKLFNSAR
jgi:geranylgeranyl pyrophosphate synthase